MLTETKLASWGEHCASQMLALGLKPAEKITYQLNHRAKKRLGLCKKVGNAYTIEISAFLNEADEKAVETVLYHELLHTCRGCMDHGALWKKYAALLGESLGLSITRCTKVEGEVGKAFQNYSITCQGCGYVFYRQRKSKVIQNPQWYRCSHCGGKLLVTKL